MSDSSKQYDLVAIGAHPDDVEVGAGGVLIDLGLRGYKCGIIVLTEGEMGTGGTPEIRNEELKEAASIMGADVLGTFNWGDCRLEDSPDHRHEVAKIIRQARPEILITPYPHIGHGRRQSHADHVASGVIGLNAANLAALGKADLPGEPHLVARIFHYFLPPGVTADFVVDISPHVDKWLEALSAHRSQFLNPEKSKDYLEHLKAMARSYGLQSRCQYGQGFVKTEPILIDNIMKLASQDESKA